jgi:FlaG/FlaF family flagellin (archaellin)
MVFQHDEMKNLGIKIGFVLVIIGVIWTSLVFNETEKIQDSVLLEKSNSFETKIEFTGSDIGYYKLYMPEFSGNEIFVQVLDTKNNIIQEQKIQTKMSVGYFDFSKNGIHTLKITNISKDTINLQTELGNTNSQKMFPSGIMILVGAVLIIITSYFKIKNYKIEQPEANIS